MKSRILTLRQNERHVFPPTFRDEQETLCGLPFVFHRLWANWHNWVHGARRVKCFCKHQFADKRQKMKGRAPKVSYLSRKVGWKSWRPFGCSVKNAQFHLTKQLYWWVLNLEVEWYSTSSIFWLSNIFNFFVPNSPASSKLTKFN